ncbi:unnamed protein product [Vitrella brassicaformis CCMP3155]|uniref:Uncharacterized protein n=2 Tax=Vitrella brassicaformis TaxID=1169539 RepID=A0A0G4EN16_VITBC|nr:unnamed protein product [Vitrella brassicaformis CCMP3155]|eukprot:CEL98385.1 unnamed protein product [Vitrella brassicaformis CCMP3155]
MAIVMWDLFVIGICLLGASAVTATTAASGASEAFVPSRTLPAAPQTRRSVQVRRGDLRMENFFGQVGLDQAEVAGVASSETLLRKYLREEKKDIVPPTAAELRDEYPLLDRLRDLKLLSALAESGLLRALEEKGLTLSQVEKALPVAERFGLLSLAANNLPTIKNTLLPLLVEPAPALLPIATAAVKAPTSLYTAVIPLALTGAEVGVHLGFNSIPLDVVAALPLLGGAAASFTVGSFLEALGSGNGGTTTTTTSASVAAPSLPSFPRGALAASAGALPLRAAPKAAPRASPPPPPRAPLRPAVPAKQRPAGGPAPKPKPVARPVAPPPAPRKTGPIPTRPPPASAAAAKRTVTTPPKQPAKPAATTKAQPAGVKRIVAAPSSTSIGGQQLRKA